MSMVNFALKQDLSPEFDVFFQVRNRYLLSYAVLEAIGLIVLTIALFWITDNDKEDEYLMTTVVGYLVYNFIPMLLYFMGTVYVPICQIVTYSQRLKDVAQKRVNVVLDVVQNADVDMESLQQIFGEYTACYGKIIGHKVFELESQIVAWIEQNKDQLNKSQISAILSQQNDVRCHLGLFLQSAFEFYGNYQKNIVSGRYRESYIPPMVFTEDDIAQFRSIRQWYRIGE